MPKRLFDLVLAALALLLLSPLFALLALWIRLDSAGPVFYRQERVGRHGRTFRIHKFRSMRADAGGLPLTVGEDPRITRAGAWLRRTRLDELPQPIDVLQGRYCEVVAPGFKYNLTDIAAALGLQQLRRAHAFHRRRAAIADRYDTLLAGLPLVLPPRPPAADLHAWHLYAVRLADGAGIARDRFIERLYAAGIGCSVHYIPLHLHPYWRERYGLEPAMFPHSQHAYERLVSLPIYTRMSDADVDRVASAVRAALDAE